MDGVCIVIFLSFVVFLVLGLEFMLYFLFYFDTDKLTGANPIQFLDRMYRESTKLKTHKQSRDNTRQCSP